MRPRLDGRDLHPTTDDRIALFPLTRSMESR